VALLASCGGEAAHLPAAAYVPMTGAIVPAASPSPLPLVVSPPALPRTAAPSPATTPDARPAIVPVARAGPFAMDLYRENDFVSQSRADWCVPASIQTMMNVIDAAAKRSHPNQRTLDRLARSLSSARLVGLGSEPQGWAGALNKQGYGPYVVVAEPARRAAIAAAARAIRLTGKPVGLLMWRGAHAWVMSGFETTADPARTDDFTVTHVRVSDPWYPRTSSIWGRARGPDARIAVADLARSLLPWHRPTVRYAELDGRFVLVMPVVPPGAPPLGPSGPTAGRPGAEIRSVRDY